MEVESSLLGLLALPYSPTNPWQRLGRRGQGPQFARPRILSSLQSFLVGGKGVYLLNVILVCSCEGCHVGIWPQGTFMAGSAGFVYVHMCISMLVFLCAQRKDRTGVWGGKVHADLCGPSRGYSP